MGSVPIKQDKGINGMVIIKINENIVTYDHSLIKEVL